ncbi:MAG: glucose-6-phosphate dehydrogenase, partial [Eubacteriales bacterium]|nr:glucose-6-phosphate dehydrogenase [Eubacteriales bacterium]
MLNSEGASNREGLSMLIFGGTGDLAHRKLLPALYHLMAEGRLPEDTRVIAIGRKPRDDQAYRSEAEASIAAHSRTQVDKEQLARFMQRLHYHQMEFI